MMLGKGYKIIRMTIVIAIKKKRIPGEVDKDVRDGQWKLISDERRPGKG
jgi:hypothetical protein